MLSLILIIWSVWVFYALWNLSDCGDAILHVDTAIALWQYRNFGAGSNTSRIRAPVPLTCILRTRSLTLRVAGISLHHEVGKTKLVRCTQHSRALAEEYCAESEAGDLRKTSISVFPGSEDATQRTRQLYQLLHSETFFFLVISQ